jgi:hypothetical protein
VLRVEQRISMEFVGALRNELVRKVRCSSRNAKERLMKGLQALGAAGPAARIFLSTFAQSDVLPKREAQRPQNNQAELEVVFDLVQSSYN